MPGVNEDCTCFVCGHQGAEKLAPCESLGLRARSSGAKAPSSHLGGLAKSKSHVCNPADSGSREFSHTMLDLLEPERGLGADHLYPRTPSPKQECLQKEYSTFFVSPSVKWGLLFLP